MLQTLPMQRMPQAAGMLQCNPSPFGGPGQAGKIIQPRAFSHTAET